MLRRAFVLAACAAALVLGAASSGAAPGDLDPTFGHFGEVVTPVGKHHSEASAVALQPDGKIVAAGMSGDGIGVARYTTAGRLDPTFGADGKVLLNIGLSSNATGVAIDSHRRVLVVGNSFNEDSFEAVLVRYRPDGTLDPSFGTNGYVRESFGTPFAGAASLELQSDGKIVVVGFATDWTPEDEQPPVYWGVVARYDEDGSPDASFGSSGRVKTVLGSASSALFSAAIQRDGKVVVGGFRLRFEPTGVVQYFGFGLARYDRTGAPDMSFGTRGIVTTKIGAGGALGAITLQDDGKIVAAGSTLALSAEEADPDEQAALARYRGNGSLDEAFGRSGIVVSRIRTHSRANDVAVLGTGKIVTSGVAELGAVGATVNRYRPDGSRDETFGDHGQVETTFGGESASASGVAVQPDGKIVIAGSLFDSHGASRFALARYLDRQPLCVVPDVKGRRLAPAKHRIARGGCRTGRVKRVRSKVPRGRVVSQSPWPDAHRVAGTRVKLVVSKGKLRHR